MNDKPSLHDSSGRKPWRPSFLLVGFLLGTGLWLLESLLHALLIDHDSLVAGIGCHAAASETWMKSVAILSLLVFGYVVDRLIHRERVLRGSLEKLIHALIDVDVMQQARESENPTLQDSSGVATLSGIIDLAGRVAHQASRSAEGVRDLLDVTARLATSNKLDEAMNQLYDALRNTIPFDRLGLAVLSSGGATVTSVWARADYSSMGLGKGYSAPLAGSSLEALLDSRVPRILNDLEAYLAAHPHSKSTQRMLDEGIRSSLTCPLFVQGRPLGYIFFSSQKPNTYTGAHVVRFKLVAGHVAAVVERGLQHELLLEEKRRSEALLLNVIPERIARRLRKGELPIVEYHDEIAVMFIDVVGFTPMVERFPPVEIARFLQAFFASLDAVMEQHEVEKIKTIGDAYMVISRGRSNGGLEKLCLAALDARAQCLELRAPDGERVAIRGAVAIGPALGGVLEHSKFAYDIWGSVVNRASRLSEVASIGEILVTEDVFRRLYERCAFEKAEVRNLRGVGLVQTYRLTGLSTIRRLSSAGGMRASS